MIDPLSNGTQDLSVCLVVNNEAGEPVLPAVNYLGSMFLVFHEVLNRDCVAVETRAKNEGKNNSICQADDGCCPNL